MEIRKGQSHNICNRLRINQPRAKTRWCCCSYSRDSLTPTEISITVITNHKANGSDLTSSFRLDRQLQADICKCKCRSYSRPLCVLNQPLSALSQALSVTPSSLLPAFSVAQNGDQKVEVNRPSPNPWTYARTHRLTDNCNFSIVNSVVLLLQSEWSVTIK